MATEDFSVTQDGRDWAGRAGLHRSLKVKRCNNGYIVDYTAISIETERKFGEQPAYECNTKQETRVFITNENLFEFLHKYFEGEPKP